jgi:hypothetical protein
MDLWSPLELELYARALAPERERERCDPVPPAKPGFWAVRRRRLARRLVGLGLRLDADASRAVLGSETAPQLNGSDA